MSTRKLTGRGPFRASHLPPGSDYELVDGHPVHCAPTGRAGEPFTVATSGQELHAPEFLANPVPVDALWDAEAADRATLRNLLERFGYRDIEAVREEGRQEGREEGREERRAAACSVLRRVLASRGIVLDNESLSRVDAEQDAAVIDGWVERAAVASGAAEVFDDG